MIGSYLQKIQQGINPCESMCNGGGGGSQPNNTTSVQTTTKEIPAWAQPSAQNLLARGESLSQQPYQQYNQPRIADMTSQQTQGLENIQNRAMYGSPEELNARNQFNATMTGQYLSPDSNPWLKANVDRSLGDIQSRINSQFGGNNYGTTAHQETLQRGLEEAANSAYGQNYASERNNQMKNMLLSDQFGKIDYNNAQQLIGVGDIYRQESQDRLNNQYSDWQAMMNQPYRQLDVLANALGASVNGAGNVQSAGYAANPYTANRYASAIGGALGGYSLGNALGGDSGWGGAAGAGLGGLLGYFGS